MKSAFRSLQLAPVSAVALALLLLFSCAVSWADPKVCGQSGQETLNPYGDVKNNFMTDLKVVGICDINGTPTQGNSLLYVFHNVNVVNGGKLIFHDDFDVDFYAESILVENGGTLTAVSTNIGFLPQASKAASALPFQKRLTFHLWGAPEDPALLARAIPSPKVRHAVSRIPCGRPIRSWRTT